MAAPAFDLVVVGRGLVGSAAAKHALLAEPSWRVALVGPSEASQPAAGVHGCHADEGRITRSLDTDGVWAELAARSMRRYEAIERESGIRFHAAVGCLAVGRADGPYLETVARVARDRRVELETVDEATLKSRWPELRLDASLFGDYDDDEGFETTTPSYGGLFEAGSAGHVSPRKLLEAQLVLFRRSGGCVIDAVVDAISDDHLTCRDGATIRAKRVLVATNAWTNFSPLLPRRVKLELTTQTTVRRRVPTGALDHLPSLIVKGGSDPFGALTAKLDACYFLPPIQYDDDACYVKIGHGTIFERPLATEDEARAWYEPTFAETRDDSYARCRLAALLTRLLDSAPTTTTSTSDDEERNVVVRCVIPKTPTKRPYLHRFSKRLACCVGCNGYAAKSSDELGRLASRLLMTDQDDYGPNIPPDAFRIVFDD
mmetsp:Transcript_15659/g.49004  ORF Transcript_15659/g.49004 Transcript_15659/m.49004 type:complete len:430 (+) Transcript_15659:19-1308(+)